MIEPAGHDEILLDELASRLADRQRVDWDDSQRRSPNRTTTLGHLREIELLMRAHQGDDPIVEPVAPPVLFTWGRLEVRAALGRGGFADVYRAHDPALHRDVALKLRREDAGSASSARWLAEARSLARVRHPNVLAIHGADMHDGRAGLWTELIEGETLEAWLERNGAMGATEASAVGVALCAALAAVHRAGLVHGDIKTKNVMRRAAARAGVGAVSGASSTGRTDAAVDAGAGDIVLMDFGASLASGPEAQGSGSSSEGTPLAMAPELFEGGPASAASDLYALGTLLFRLVTRRYPCEGGSLEEIRAKHARGEMLRLRDLRPDLPARFVNAVERSLATVPAARFASAAQMEAALAAPAGSAGHVAHSERRRPLAPLLVAVAVVALGFSLWAMRRELPRQQSSAIMPPIAATAPDAAPAPVAAGTAPSTTAPLAVRTSLRRLRDGLEAPVVNGSRLQPGDRLWLQLESAEPTHVYVLDEDASGEVFVLFPMAGSPVHNPLRARAALTLPGARDGRPLQWMVTSADGRETFLIVAARKPLELLERAVAAMRQPREGGPVEYARLSPGVLKQMRGVGEVVSGEAPRRGGSTAIASLVRALESRADRRELWLQVIETETPQP